MKLVSNNNKLEPVQNMLDGQLAIVRTWSNPTPIGKVVQRHGDTLIVVGGTQGNRYSFIRWGCPGDDKMVEILQPGAILEV